MSSIGAIRKKIEEAFAVAREQGLTTAPKLSPRGLKPDTKQSDHYTDVDSHQFERRADAFIKAAEHSPHVKLRRHRANSYYVGDINEQPRVEDLFTEVVKRYSDKATEK